VQFSTLSLVRSPLLSAAALDVHLKDALILFKRLGVDVRSLSAREFSLAYLQLARRYHPDRGNQKSNELMANINAARTTILKAYDHSP
jgi:DnaJ-class molecular chaperone